MAVSDQSIATSGTQLDQLCINTIRTLSMDAVQKANSGHPGAPMALAPVADRLWQQFLRYDPEDPIWPNRDRFVLSNGTRVHAALFAALSGERPRGNARWKDSFDPSRFARRDQEFPPTGQ